LEDQERGLDSNQKMTPPVKGGRRNRKEFTIMVIRSVGKIRSFKISHRIILITSVFFSLYILTSIYIFNGYFSLRATHKILTQKTETLEKDQKNNQKILQQKDLYVTSLEDYMQGMRDEYENPGNEIKKSGTDQKQSPEIESVKNITTSSRDRISGNVEIRDLIFRKADTDLSLDFKLANSKSEENAAGGYIHIIAMDINKACPETWNSSRNRLFNCSPVNYKHGRPFLIQRFKSYHENFKLNSDSELPSFIKILVYDQSGQIILEKEFQVINVSATKNM